MTAIYFAESFFFSSQKEVSYDCNFIPFYFRTCLFTSILKFQKKYDLFLKSLLKEIFKVTNNS